MQFQRVASKKWFHDTVDKVSDERNRGLIIRVRLYLFLRESSLRGGVRQQSKNRIENPPLPRQIRFMKSVFTGPVYVVRDNIDTDQIIPAQYLTLVPTMPDEYEKLGSYALCGLPDSLYPIRFVREGQLDSEHPIENRRRGDCGPRSMRCHNQSDRPSLFVQTAGRGAAGRGRRRALQLCPPDRNDPNAGLISVRRLEQTL